MPEYHKDQLPEDGIHVAIRWRVPTQVERDALAVTDADVGGLLVQDDVMSLFVLLSAAPVTWSQVPDGESTLAAILAINAEVLERVEGPATANDNAIALFDGSTGKLIKESVASIDNLGNITTGGTVDGVDISNLAMALALMAVPDYVTLSSTPTLGNERVLTQGPGILITDGGAGGPVTVSNTLALKNGTAPYTLVLSDAWKLVGVYGSSGSTLTVPSDTAVAYPVGTLLHVLQTGTGQVTLAADLGVTLTSPAGYSLSLQNQCSVATLVKTGANTWYTFGDFTPTTTFVTLSASANLANERVLTPGAGITLTDGGAGGALTVAKNMPLTTKSASYTLVLTDAGKNIQFYTSNAVALTIPANASVAFPNGTEIFVMQTNTGSVSITLDSGVQLLADNHREVAGPAANVVSLSGVHATIRLLKTGTDQWAVNGDLVPYVGTVAGTTYTLASGDIGNIVTTTNAAPVTITIPLSSMAAPVGCRLTIAQLGAGQVTLSPAASVTLNVPVGFAAKTRGQFSEVVLTKVAADTWDISGDLEGGAALLLNNQTGTAYTLVLADAPKCVTMNNAAANTLTIPSNASVAFPIGTVITVMQLGVGQTTIAITTDTLNNPALTAKLRARYSVASLTKITATSWVLSGDLAAV